MPASARLGAEKRALRRAEAGGLGAVVLVADDARGVAGVRDPDAQLLRVPEVEDVGRSRRRRGALAGLRDAAAEIEEEAALVRLAPQVRRDLRGDGPGAHESR